MCTCDFVEGSWRTDCRPKAGGLQRTDDIVLMGANETIDRMAGSALDEERALVATLGGFTLEIAGARLVTNERIPVPRFNFVQEVRIAPARQSAFFEKALDHYFQRALRPTMRVPEPVPEHLDRGLRSFGFRPIAEPHSLLMVQNTSRSETASPSGARQAREDELDDVVAFWAPSKEAEELRRAVEVAWTHPNPGERLVPWVVERSGRPAAVALVHAHGDAWGIHAVATQPTSRGQGVATELVNGALGEVIPPGAWTALHAESSRLVRHLEPLGFQPARVSRIYELPASAALVLPRGASASGPLWRPPRAAPPPD